MDTLNELLHRLHEAGLHDFDLHTAIALAWQHSPRAATEIAEAAIAKAMPTDEQLTAAGALTPSAVKAIAEEHGISEQDADPLAEADRRIAELRAEFAPQAAGVPWLDTRPLAPAELPRPWSEDDWQRDRRRAEATGVLPELSRTIWEGYAEAGKDAVTELLTELRDARIGELEHQRLAHLELIKQRKRNAAHAEKMAAEGKPAAGAGRLVHGGRGIAL